MRTMDIEALLRWAFTDELPKEGAPIALRPSGDARGWRSVEAFGEMLARIDEPNRWGVMSGSVDLGRPHPDAVVIGEAVAELDAVDVCLPEGWNPLGDLARGDLGVDGERLLAEAVRAAFERATRLGVDGRTRVLRSSLAALVRTCAVLGRTPVWEADAPKVVSVKSQEGREIWWRRATVMDKTGMPYETELPDGYDLKRKRVRPDAYRKFVLEPDPMEAAIGRAEYEVWHAALGYLVALLDGRLVDHVATGPARAIRPWETGETAPARVLSDIGAQHAGNAAPLTRHGVAARRARSRKVSC